MRNLLRLPFGPLLFSVALLASLSVGFVGVRSLADSREAAVHLAEVRSRNLVNSADQNITAMLDRIDHTLRSVVSSIERELISGDLDPARMKHILAFEEKHLPEAVAIRVTNSGGTVILNNPSGKPRTSMADRPFFPYLKEHPEAGLFVTKPVQGLFTRKWAIPCARRYNLPDGRFGGIVVAPVLLEHFEKALGGYDVGPGGLSVLRDIDGGFIARYPAVVKGRTLPVGDKTISRELQALIRSGVSQETYFSLTPYDQTKRTVTFRRMKAAPLIVVAGLAEEDYLAQWFKDRTRTLAVVAAFIAGTWIMAWLLWRSWKGHESDAEALRESETKYRNLVETAQELVWKCDVQGRFTYLNPAWEKTHGYKIEEMLGRSFGEFQRPEVFERDKQEFARELVGGSVTEYETTHIARDGRELTLLLNVVPEVNARGEIIGTQGTAIDITERKLAEDALKKEKEKLGKYLDISAVIVVILDVDQKVILINKRGCELLGYVEEEIVGKDWFETFLPEKARHETKKAFAKLLSGNLEPVEYYENAVLTKSGEERLIAWYNTVLRDEKNNITGTLSSGGDITENKMAFDKIKESLKEKELLLREVHHRVKNNMQVISSLLSLQSDQIKDSQYADMFSDTGNRIKTMSLVHEKLYMSKDMTGIDFKDYIDDLSRGLLSVYGASAKDISLTIDAENIFLELDTAIPCGLVVSELLSNSLKHAFPGGRKGEINVHLGRTMVEGKTVYDLVVSDNGVGIPEEIDIRKTTSLGLQLVMTLAEHQLRGTVDLDRTKGTKFHIRFREISYGKRM